MLFSVKLYNKPCRMAVEVHNVSVDGSLPTELNRISRKKAVPKAALLRCHTTPHYPCERQIFSVVRQRHFPFLLPSQYGNRNTVASSLFSLPQGRAPLATAKKRSPSYSPLSPSALPFPVVGRSLSQSPIASRTLSAQGAEGAIYDCNAQQLCDRTGERDF